ncbi:expressed protein [Phakopsora pachyrhizi]|uniref:Expressed protein n=1 Tax=Phakopsora pachyrhizi TaxID=170000 RepID=A0AAV0B3C6_PHAPC|nr:expressed protein [Phakopsora pachyrhizi]
MFPHLILSHLFYSHKALRGSKVLLNLLESSFDKTQAWNSRARIRTGLDYNFNLRSQGTFNSIRPFIKSSEERSKTSSNRREQLKLRSQLSLSLDEMLAVFMKLPTVTAEDKLMKEDISDKPATQLIDQSQRDLSIIRSQRHLVLVIILLVRRETRPKELSKTQQLKPI